MSSLVFYTKHVTVICQLGKLMPKEAKNTTLHAANRGNSCQDQLPVEHDTLENGSLSLERVEYTSGGSLVPVS